MRRTPPILVIAVVALTGLSALTSPDESRGVAEDGAARAAIAATEAPNVLLIVTHDQRYDTLWAMPNVRNLLGAHGVTFTDAVVSNPLCCPSRATILTGTYSHTNDVWRNGPPHGGFPSFDDSATLATTLDAAGYRTGIFGKYLNLYRRAAPDYVPPGWDRWFVFDAPAYYGYKVIDGRSFRRFGHRPADYSTTVLADEAVSFIEDGAGPFFAYFAPYAPHGPSTPGPRDERTPMDKRVAPDASFNEADVSDKPAWARGLGLLGPSRSRRCTRRTGTTSVRCWRSTVRSAGWWTPSSRGASSGTRSSCSRPTTASRSVSTAGRRSGSRTRSRSACLSWCATTRSGPRWMSARVRSSRTSISPPRSPSWPAWRCGDPTASAFLAPQLLDPRAAMARQGVLLEHLAKKTTACPRTAACAHLRAVRDRRGGAVSRSVPAR